MAAAAAMEAPIVAPETSGDDHEHQEVDGGPVPASEVDTDHGVKQHPKPPSIVDLLVDPETPYAKGSKLKCWWPNCNKVRISCDSLLVHVRSDHSVKPLPPDWHDTEFVQKAVAEKTHQQKGRRENPNPKAKPRKNKKAEDAGGSVPGGTGQQDVIASASSSSALVSKQHYDATSQAAIVATTVNSGLSTSIIKPGTTGTVMFVPSTSFRALLRDGFLREVEDGKVEWLDTSVKVLQHALLKALPSGMQSMLLAREFDVSTDIVQAEQGMPLEVKLTLESGAFNLAAASMPPFLRGVLGEIVNVMHQMKKFMSGAPSVEQQKLKIKEDWESFTWSEAARKKDRRKYPYKPPQLKYEPLAQFLIARGLKEKSRKIHLQSFERFVDMFETVDPRETLNVNNILINVYMSDLFPKLTTMQLLEPNFTFSLKLVKTLGHAAGMAKSVFYKRDEKARNTIDQIIEDNLGPWSEVCYKARKEREGRKGDKDAEILSNYHSRDKLKEVALFCYLCLKTIHYHVCDAKDIELNRSLLFKAVSYFVGALYSNTPPSRSMEIETLLTKMVMMFSIMELKLIATPHPIKENYDGSKTE